jgi:uncharacterized protein (TIGR02284 family)
MDNQEMAQKLGSLVQLDIDAIHAYKEAIEEIDVSEIRQQLSSFQSDHSRHVQELSDLIRHLGETPPEFSRDFKGFLIQGFTALRSISGTEGALKAMRSNEKLTNSTYDQARSWKLEPTARELVEKNYRDEQRHLQYIEETIANRTWEKR